MAILLSILLPLFLLAFLPFSVTAGKYKITGNVTCLQTDPDGKKYYRPINGQKVEFWEEDWPDWDDQLGDAITDQNGHFTVEGSDYEGENEPYLWIQHKCNSACTIRTTIELYHRKSDQSLTINLDGVNDWAESDEGRPLLVKMWVGDENPYFCS